MTDTHQKQLGNTLWSIADQLLGAMHADGFRNHMHFRPVKLKGISFVASRK